MRKYRRKAGDLGQLRTVLWQVVLEIEALVEAEDCPAERLLRAAHALSQLAGTYTKLAETADLEERLAKLEASMAAGRNA